ncbi:hypothetical protein N0V93_009962 [Gnomoniopsis smithogilvyi]|uniref:AMP-dependent synthetase/ligase domain-containing protein n=1 Tax=Gnomoniopsis smithogilvyi TaxID=1191159 RepID=A0A9W8YL28_9PEZI|nr:hypothetical protein N0V93_009962 [Gnomoniopsis smithogilvyi]
MSLSTAVEVPANCGRRLLPVVIDQIARDDPERPWASLPVDDWNLSAGYEDISYRTLANAINKLAHFIVKHVGRSPPGRFETLAYLGVSDVRYHLLQMAVVKTGHQVLFSSQLNTREVHLDLMEQTHCRFLLTAAGVHVRDIIAEKGEEIVHIRIPELDDLLDDSTPASPFPYNKTYEEAAHDPILILHSSGTSGNPKPIVINHAAFASADRFAFLSLTEGADGRARAMEWTHPGKGVHMMEDVARRPDAERIIKKLDSVYFSGAVLSPFGSRLWSQHCRNQNAWASTETSGIPQLIAESDEYEYSAFDIEAAGIKFQDTGAILIDAQNGGRAEPLFEMILEVTPASAPYAFWAHRQGFLSHDAKPLASVSPSLLETKIGDLWTPHPNPAKAKYVWRFAGRSDDLITFSTGSNLHPSPITAALAGSSLVTEAIILGAGRRQPLAVIEMAEGIDCSEGTAQQLWDTVIDGVNSKLPTFGGIARSHMLLVPHGAFPRTAKGSASRKDVERKYAAEVEAIYDRFGDQWRGERERYGSVIVETTISLSSDATGPE